MIFRQFYLACLAHASYLVGSRGEAAVVDPQRDVARYVAEADANGLVIRWIIETHLHADFVSGHRELAERTGATVLIGREAAARFPHRAVSDGERLQIGDLTLTFLETPWHTPESICILIGDGVAPPKLLTGDTLFIGDVGRPDLAGGAGFTPAEMASMLYDSLHRKILTFADDVEVYPAHGAGSLCGKNISRETSSTIGMQRRSNYALAPMPKVDFVRMMTADLAEAPSYFSRDAMINREGARSLDDLPRPRVMNADEVQRQSENGAVVLDVRNMLSFGVAHLPGSINIGLGGQYASWAGALIDAGDELLLVTERDDQVEEAVIRLARVGLENARGYLGGGVDTWMREDFPVASTPQISVFDLQQMIETRPELQVIDVRRSGEYCDAHARGAENLPLHELPRNAARLDRTRPAAVICAGGYRSSIGASLLERFGFREVFNVTGGTAAWQAAGLPTER